MAYRLEKKVPDDPTPETVEHDLVFVGLIGMIDPPRPEAALAIATARRAGLRTMMITGDYPDTARAIAQQLNLPLGTVKSRLRLACARLQRLLAESGLRAAC